MKKLFHLNVHVWTMLLAMGLQASASEGITGETMTIQPAGKVTWGQMLATQALTLSATIPTVAPFMPAPAPKEIGGVPALQPQATENAPVRGLVSPAPSTIATMGFQGLLDNGLVIPPDTNGAVGPNHVMTMLNSEVRIQNKTGAILSTVSLTTFWTAGTGLFGSPFDPKVVYDSLSGRWIAACDADARSTTSKVFFAISDTNDPTGNWTFYSFDADGASLEWADFPSLGVNATWIAITNNMHTVMGNIWAGAKMMVIDKATALTGGALTITVFPAGFDNGGGYTSHSLQPAITFDVAEPKLYIVDNGGWYSGGIFLGRISEITGTGPVPVWSATAGSSFANSGFFTVANNFNYYQIDAAQLGSANLVETNDARALNAVFRNGRLWYTHSAGLPVAPAVANRTASFWYQLNPAAMPTPIAQSGVIDPGDGEHVFYPSISANRNNDAVIGFSRSDTTRYAEGAYAARRAGDVLGTMGPVQVTKVGEAPYYKTFGSGRNRWGDYSSTVIDPSDDLTFWTLQEYAATPVGGGSNDDRWGTWWARIRSKPLASSDFNGDSRSDILWRNTSSGLNYLYVMNAEVIAGGGTINVVSGSDWQIVGTGDYDGNNTADILWRNGLTGENRIYFMDGNTIVSQGSILTVGDTDWQVAGSGDYNGDGKSDILWRHAGTGQNHIWFMNGLTIASQGTVNFVPTDWQVMGSGDLNGDGNSDILWRRTSDGRNHAYLMSGNVIASQGTINTVPLNWMIAGTGDYNGDGKSDILWHRTSDGRVHMYFLNGFAIASQGTVGTVPLDWDIVGDGDYDGDGKADILWRNMTPGDGRNYMYFMNGNTIAGQGAVNTVSNFDWMIVNVR